MTFAVIQGFVLAALTCLPSWPLSPAQALSLHSAHPPGLTQARVKGPLQLGTHGGMCVLTCEPKAGMEGMGRGQSALPWHRDCGSVACLHGALDKISPPSQVLPHPSPGRGNIVKNVGLRCPPAGPPLYPSPQAAPSPSCLPQTQSVSGLLKVCVLCCPQVQPPLLSLSCGWAPTLRSLYVFFSYCCNNTAPQAWWLKHIYYSMVLEARSVKWVSLG